MADEENNSPRLGETRRKGKTKNMAVDGGRVIMMTFNDLQTEVAKWGRHNFPKSLPHHPLLGASEEIGELAHAHLKSEQGIRGTYTEHHVAKADAVGDIVIYLAHYCELNGLNFTLCVQIAWDGVKKRDWIAFPGNGMDK